MANYINNKTLLKHLIEYKKRKKQNPNERIDDYIAKAIIQIAEKFASKPNFSGYTYKEDMVSDAIENVIRYIDNFDPEKSENPFAYITQICHYAFLRRIKDEKTQTYVRFKSIQKFFYEDNLPEIEHLNYKEEGYDFSHNNQLYENMKEFISSFEDDVVVNKKKSQEYNRRLLERKKEEKKDSMNILEFE